MEMGPLYILGLYKTKTQTWSRNMPGAEHMFTVSTQNIYRHVVSTQSRPTTPLV